MQKPTGEFNRISAISKILGRPSAQTIVGIGDDAAIVKQPPGQLLLCADAMVSGRDFDLSLSKPDEIGHKALAAVLSDIAAMNGQPAYAMFSIACPPRLPDDFLNGFYLGAGRLARELAVDIVGGDLGSSQSEIFIDAVAIGGSERPILRAGARVGDWLAISGQPGTSAAGLAWLKQNGRVAIPQDLLRAHLLPRPRFDLLPELATPGLCTALIDVSDGVSSEAHHLATASGVGFLLEAEAIPRNSAAVALAQKLGVPILDWILGGGEDYELLATLDPTLVEKHGWPRGFTCIGRAVEAGEGLKIRETGAIRSLDSTGFDHFK